MIVFHQIPQNPPNKNSLSRKLVLLIFISELKSL